MNHYEFKDIYIGQEESFIYEINEEKMKMFLNITGDVNPLHNSENFAKEKGYTEKVVYGLLTSSALSTLAGVYLPGEKSLIHNIEVSFVSPVYLSNCPLTVIGKVVSKDERFLQITLKFVIKDNKNNKVSRGQMKVGFLK